MSFNLKAKVRLGYFIAFILLLVSYFLIFYIVQKLVKGTKAVSTSYGIINKLESFKGMAIDAETGARGYLVSKDENFLEPYHNAVKQIPVIYKELQEFFAGNIQQEHNLDTMYSFINKKLWYMNKAFTDFKANGLIVSPAMIIDLHASKLVMDTVRKYIARMKEEEESRMTERNTELGAIFNSTNTIAITSLIVALITIIYSVVVYNRENKAKEEADGKARRYRVELENKVEELKQVNTELYDLKQIEKFAATGRIARTIAHEVRNPLTNISLATEQMKEAITQNDESGLLLDMIRRNVGRIDQLVSDLLHSTRFAQLNFIKVRVSQLVDETLEAAKDRIELNNITVHKKYSGEQYVLIDAEKIKLGLLNIVVNAIESMEKGKGVLTVSVYANGDKCLIEIEDNGSGMDDDTIQKIYEPYYTGKARGTGLGLTHTQNIILNHRGNISVKSTPGKGTTFFVALDMS